jgi:tRNA (guanine37-N1)-methyltransferase
MDYWSKGLVMMNFHILTLFPEMVLQGLHTSILKRAVDNGYINIEAVNIRDYTLDKHGKVDDYPYGGGAGMLMQAQPVYDAYKAVEEKILLENDFQTSAEDAGFVMEGSAASGSKKPRVIYVTPQGNVFHQKMAQELAQEENLIFLCGHYEGIDERVLEEIVTDYVSIGDYVLTGGELPAMVMIDAIARLVPGVLHNEESASTESFHDNLLEYPQYSRPEIWRDKAVPPILLSGDHAKVDQWRLEQSIERTKRQRPDLYEKWATAHEDYFVKKKKKG